MSDDKKSVTIKTILDKTGITKEIKEVQGWIKRNPLQISPKLDMKSVEKEVRSKMDKINKQIKQSQDQAQSQISQKTQAADSVSSKSDVPKTSAISGSPPITSTSKQGGGLIRLFGKISTSPFLATAGFSSDACEACL